eukprot:1065663-Prorocentrum_minimum.AAC.1
MICLSTLKSSRNSYCSCLSGLGGRVPKPHTNPVNVDVHAYAFRLVPGDVHHLQATPRDIIITPLAPWALRV